jgi:histidine phosphotransferase ChpT
MVAFDRIAFGASAAAETLDPRELEQLARGIFAHQRAKLDWAIGPGGLPKAAGRALLNLAQLCGGALPTGGVARLEVSDSGGELVLVARGSGARARLRPEVLDGLNGLRLADGLAGHWVQAFYLHGLVTAARGTVKAETGEGEVTLTVRLPR